MGQWGADKVSDIIREKGTMLGVVRASRLTPTAQHRAQDHVRSLCLTAQAGLLVPDSGPITAPEFIIRRRKTNFGNCNGMCTADSQSMRLHLLGQQPSGQRQATCAMRIVFIKLPIAPVWEPSCKFSPNVTSVILSVQWYHTCNLVRSSPKRAHSRSLGLMFKVHKQRHTSAAPSVDVLLDSLELEHGLPKPKVLKSCIRCRKHKTKCDAFERQPGSCSSCSKRGVPCKIDYVLPPQRSDNLKNLVQSVNEIKHDFRKLEVGYSQLFKVLGIEAGGFDSWKQQRLELTQHQSDEDTNDDFNLIKLPDGSFISLHLVSQEKMLYNSTLISLDDFHAKIKALVTQLHSIYNVFAAEDNDYDSDSTTSSAPSPHSPILTSCSPLTHIPLDTPFAFFGLDLTPEQLFHTNKLLLVQLLEHFYPEAVQTKNVFLSNFLDSFYNIIQSNSKSLTSSTYSTHVLTSITTTPSHFNKQQLAEHIGVEIFSGDDFLRRVVEILGIDAILKGDFQTLRRFIQFVELNVCSNRKKLHFDKTGHMRFISMTLYLINVFQQTEEQRKRRSTKNYELLEDLIHCLNDSDSENPEYMKKLFKKFLVSFGPLIQRSNSTNIWLIDWFRQLQVVTTISLISSFPEFQAVLTHYTNGFKMSLQNPLRILIDRFFSFRASTDGGMTMCNKQNTDGIVPELCCTRMTQLASIACSREQPGVRMADIQMILEQVDWRKDSADDVLKKIGVL